MLYINFEHCLGQQSKHPADVVMTVTMGSTASLLAQVSQGQKKLLWVLRNEREEMVQQTLPTLSMSAG